MTRTLGGENPDEGIQEGVDLLEVALGRPVILEDTQLRPIAYSKQPDDIDAARLHVILHRGVTPEFLRAYQALGIRSAHGPMWTPALPEFEAEPRLCIPVRRGRSLLAYLWVLAPEGSLTEQQLAAAEGTASFVATALDAQRRQRRMTEQHNQLALARLLDGDREQTEFLGLITTAEDLTSDSRVIVTAFECPQARRGHDVIDTALQIKEHLPHVRLPVHWMVHLGRRPAVLAVLGPGAEVSEDAVARAVQSALEASFVAQVAIGSGGSPVPLAQLRAAYNRAATAAWVARNVAGGTGATSWSDIGAWRLLARLSGLSPGDSDLRADLHPGLLKLLAEDRDDLLKTLDAYLTTGCDARATANLLHLHRSTLYYRIERLEEITEVSLRDGETRFELTLGLRIATLLGLLPGQGPTNVRIASGSSDT